MPGVLLGWSNRGYKQGISPEAEVTMHIHAKQCEETWLQVYNAASACVGKRGVLNPSSCLMSVSGGCCTSCSASRSALGSFLLGMTKAVCKTNSNLLEPDDKFTHWL